MLDHMDKFKIWALAAIEKGFLMIFASIIAIFFANFSPEVFSAAINTTLTPQIHHSSLLYITNDLLMAIFFLLVGMEIKRELISGHLSTRAQALMPLVAAIGGMIGPMLIYIFINADYDANLSGWAIPTATDIAFTLTVLSIFGKGIPSSVRIFLTALAIIDDLIAIIIIAVYYTSSISLPYIFACFILTFILVMLNFSNVRRLWVYLVIGAVLGFCFLQSGVHATISGVILALTIPLNLKGTTYSPILKLEGAIHKPVLYFILPLFAFVNSGVVLKDVTPDTALNPITLGIALGLFLGKQLGVFTTCFVGVKLNMLKMPARARWIDMYGASILCGIGFTMSLFVGMLSFTNELQLNYMKLGVFVGSLLSIAYGAIILHIAHKGRTHVE